jgi:hypothetical protein
MNNFLSGIAVVFSFLAFVLSGFSAYQSFSLQQKISSLENTASVSANPPNTANETTPANVPLVATPNSPNASDSAIQPSQFISPIATGVGEVELASVKRVQNPDTQKRDLVMVKMNVRRLDASDDPKKQWSFSTTDATVSNPETLDKYTILDGTGVIILSDDPVGTRSGAYMKIQVPETVSAIDIYINYVEAFKNIPIEN